jgi:succinate dehydrogenase / fumarate reductase cytochrome b subunit
MTTWREPKVKRTTEWVDVRRRRLGMWAYALNRLSGLGLVLYLYLHLVVLSLLASGASGWDKFIALARTPLFLSLDVLLLTGLLIHGLNGIRVTLNGLGVGVRSQKSFFVVLMLVAAVTLIVAAWRIFGK